MDVHRREIKLSSVIGNIQTWRGDTNNDAQQYPELAWCEKHKAKSGVAFLGGVDAYWVALGVVRGLIECSAVERAGFWSMAGEACALGARFVFGPWTHDAIACGRYVGPEGCSTAAMAWGDEDCNLGEWASAPFAASSAHASSVRSRHEELDRLACPRRAGLPMPLFAAYVRGPKGSPFVQAAPFVMTPVSVGVCVHPQRVELDTAEIDEDLQPISCCDFLHDAPHHVYLEVGGLVSTFAFDLEAIQAKPFEYYCKEETGSASLRKEVWFSLRRAVELASSKTGETVAIFTPPPAAATRIVTADVEIVANIDAITPLLQRGADTIFVVVTNADFHAAERLLDQLFEDSSDVLDSLRRDMLTDCATFRLVTKCTEDATIGVPAAAVVFLHVLYCGFHLELDGITLDPLTSRRSTAIWLQSLPRRTRRHLANHSDALVIRNLLANFVAWLLVRNSDFITAALLRRPDREQCTSTDVAILREHSSLLPHAPENTTVPARP